MISSGCDVESLNANKGLLQDVDLSYVTYSKDDMGDLIKFGKTYLINETTEAGDRGSMLNVEKIVQILNSIINSKDPYKLVSYINQFS